MLKLHFLNVGDGDCCIVEFPEHTSMIDINRSRTIDSDSAKEIISAIKYVHPERSVRGFNEVSNPNELLQEAGYQIEPQDPLEYLIENNIKTLFRFISSHAHMDHLRDFGKLNDEVGFSNIWVVKNSFGPNKKLEKKSRKSDWNTYLQFRDSNSNNTKEKKSPTTTVIRAMENISDDFYNNDNIKILSPNPELLKIAKDTENTNLMSYVLLIQYGPHKIVLGGDAEKENWEYIYKNYADLIKDVTILKASHHGRETGFYEKAVKYMNPQYTIVSVGDTIKPKDDASIKIQRNF